jgi:hypothetical protein
MFAVPPMERLVRPGGHLTVAFPGVEVAIKGKARQHFQRGFGRLGRGPVSLGMAQRGRHATNNQGWAARNARVAATRA